MDFEFRAFTWFTFYLDMALVRFHYVFADAQTQPAPPLFTGAGFIHPEKTVKNIGKVFFRNPDPGILNR